MKEVPARDGEPYVVATSGNNFNETVQIVVVTRLSEHFSAGQSAFHLGLELPMLFAKPTNLTKAVNF